MNEHVLTRLTILAWAALGCGPLRYWLTDAPKHRLLPILSLYAIGGIVLMAALRREGANQRLVAVSRTRSARVFCVLALCALALSSVISFWAFQITAFSIAIVWFALWGISRDESAMTTNLGRILSLCLSLGFLAVVGEFIFRSQPVRQYTGGNTPGMLEWAERNYDEIWENNPHQFRSLHLARVKSDDVFRIVTLGDSFTWGAYIDNTEKTWPYQLENILRKGGAKVEIVNLAQRGYTTVNEAEALSKYGWDFQPDLVILQTLINDPLPSGPDFYREGESWHWGTYPLLPAEFHQFFETHSYLYSFLNSRFTSIQIALFQPKGYEPLFDPAFSGWQACQRALRDMSEAASARQVPMLAVQFPRFHANSLEEGEYPHLPAHEKLCDATRAAGLPTLDLLPVFAATGRPTRDWWALPCDDHPSCDAHYVTAVAIAEWIIELDVLEVAARKRRVSRAAAEVATARSKID